MSQLKANNCQYTAISTAGTTTLNAGQSSGVASDAGVLYGTQVNAVGTAFSIACYDIVPATAAAPASTNTLIPSQTGTAGQYLTCGPPDVGVRYRGALVAVTSGTPGQILVLWD